MTTSKPHPPNIPVHPVQDDGRTRYQPLNYRPLVTTNGRHPDGPPPNQHIGRRTYQTFRGKCIRIPIIVEFVLGNLGMILSGLLVPFGTTPAHVISVIGFIGSVIILNAACCTVYAYKWKTKKAIIVAISVTILAAVASVLLVIGPVISLLRDKHVLSLVLQVFMIAVGIAELGLSSYVAKSSVVILRDGDRRRKGQIRSISGDEAPMVQH
jgi:hypothetical protein